MASSSGSEYQYEDMYEEGKAPLLGAQVSKSSTCCCAATVFEEAPTLNAPPNTIAAYEGAGPWFACMPNAVMAPRLAATGPASVGACPVTTIPAMLQLAAERCGEETVMMVERPLPALDKDGKPPPALPLDKWTAWTYEEYCEDVKRAAKGFMKLGYAPFETVNVWGFNSPEWMISALAAMWAGGKVAGLYPTDTNETAAFKVVHSGASIVVVEDRGKIDKLIPALQARGDARRLKAFVVWADGAKTGDTITIAGAGQAGQVQVLSWDALMAEGETVSDEALQARLDGINPGHCACLIYTSGTTGDPKAVMVSHDTVVYESKSVLHVMASDGVGLKYEQERLVSYLPLSHVAGLMVDIISPIAATALTDAYFTVFFARSYDLKTGSIKDRLVAAKPTLFLGVPLVWEKIADKVRAVGAEITGMKKRISTWAKGLGLSHAKNCLLGGSGKYPFGYCLAHAAVMNPVKKTLGLDKLKFGFTGAAPIRVDTLEYFASLGISINEVYGMSESCAAVTFSSNKAHEWGSCGWTLPGCEVKAFIVDPNNLNIKSECPRAPSLDDQDECYQGELCFRGRNIMMGYLANPDLGPAHVEEIRKKTAETIDSEGWLHSGDKGMITEAGMVKITGRYKELIIGDGGENIAPVPIEDFVKKGCDGINEIMMVGDHRKYNVALVTLKAVGANGESPGTDALDAGAKRLNPRVATISAAMDDKVWIDAVTEAITAANKNGKVCPNNAFKIQKFTILPTNFSEEKNELTPTKKLKRKVVETSYKAIIEKMYSTDGTYIRYG